MLFPPHSAAYLKLLSAGRHWRSVPAGCGIGRLLAFGEGGKGVLPEDRKNDSPLRTNCLW